MNDLVWIAIATGNFPWAFTAVYILGAAAAVGIGVATIKRAREVNIEQMKKEDPEADAKNK
ncbi:MAG: hypothetical protein HC860_14385 [Alkalinema sp. RU_4_3]|nr:hypothetical protein [Alkalinema sp. RU_4_3]